MDEPRPVTCPVDQGTARLLPDVDRERAWLLTVDDAPQSYVDLADPGHLEFEYVRRIAHVLDTACPAGPLEVLHLGGGALTLPRHLAVARPGSRQQVVDHDAALLALVRRHLPVPPGSSIGCEAADAREALERRAPATADAVVADVFGGSRIPAHLTTVECVRAAGRALRPGGVHVANVADTAPFDFVRSQLANLFVVFPQVCLLAEPAVLRGRRFGNLVLAASADPLPVADLARRCAGDPFPARVVHGAALRRLAAGAAPVHDGAAAPSPVPPDGSFSLS
ncbi:fused MFS/spermidine synthase [Streptomyces sp. 549]|uniref:spermidine synthase n=1 Tax=Streptomyces sp. 549 TaxID=3049076 RepID=UPI0024C42695|nr:fused MFS/spermidine synthase [Streptomyces sp. 549]MDK1474520.1 fused MFS/spermidine synthase [Streptomyces sp. 549]